MSKKRNVNMTEISPGFAVVDEARPLLGDTVNKLVGVGRPPLPKPAIHRPPTTGELFRASEAWHGDVDAPEVDPTKPRNRQESRHGRPHQPKRGKEEK